METKKLVELSPNLYHMAELGTWQSIKERGLLSASSVLDLFKLTGAQRIAFESEQRAQKMEVVAGTPRSILLRDQKPMPKERLTKALKDGTTPKEWYELINGKVFFWANEKRLLTLLGARDYRLLEHDVLTIDTKSFVNAYEEKIWLCHMNSGNTWPIPHPRGKDVFKKIINYPVNSRGNPVRPIAELVVDGEVLDIEKFVVGVRRMRGSQVNGIIL